MALPGTRRLDQGHSQELASHTACQVDLLSMKRARLPDDSHSLGERDNSLSSSWEHRKKNGKNAGWGCWHLVEQRSLGSFLEIQGR